MFEQILMPSLHAIVDSLEVIFCHLLLTGMIFLVNDVVDEVIDIASHCFLVALVTVTIFFVLGKQLAQQRKTTGKGFGTNLLIFRICTHGINIKPGNSSFFVQI